MYITMKNITCFVMFLLYSASNLVAADPQPNVVFIAVDDMNDFVGCLDSQPNALTPNIQRLAARGVCFTNAHTAGVFCAPSRAAIFSGQYASTTGCYTTPNYFVHHPELESLQTSFTKGGYTTLGAGKLFHHPAGAIDQRNWTKFFLRNAFQRTGGWALESWSSDTPVPQPFPASEERVAGDLRSLVTKMDGLRHGVPRAACHERRQQDRAGDGGGRAGEPCEDAPVRIRRA